MKRIHALSAVGFAVAAVVGFGTVQAAGTDQRAGSYSPAAGQAGAAGQPAERGASVAEVRASHVIGREVRNPRGQSLGEIEDLVVDVVNNRVHYAILGRGGVLGIGEKKVALPVSRLRFERQDDAVVLDMTEQQLEQARGIGAGAGDWSDSRYWGEVGMYYQQTYGLPPPPAPGTVPNTESRFYRGSDMIGMDVEDANSDEVGEIEDLIVNLSNGQIRFAVLEFDRAWNPNDTLVVLPMTAFAPARERDELRLNLSREQIRNAYAFDRRNWPDLADIMGRGTVGMERSPRQTMPESNRRQ